MAYRLGMIEDALAKKPTLDLAAILRLARAVPLSPADEKAIAYASVQAGEALTPVLMRDSMTVLSGALEKERAIVRTKTAEAVKQEMGARELSRDLRAQLAPEGVVRDFDRVARTELQEARVRGAFEA